ncbi:uncharacterized protein LOC119246987 [Talpa occidentalis]|uniref:uncharacterized protein LOC119246987 n=1 Tax=Talpa occidentalis TaxID=50954 RepID=UPI00188FC7A7|nr:uncharacterized protein LOC119246987 [Talpa occidentalis]
MNMSLRPVTHQGPPHLRAEEQGQQRQHILAVFLPKPVLQLVKPQGKHTVFKMSKEVIYVNRDFAYSEKQDERHATHKRREFPWHSIAVSLGILCLLLLLATSGLGIMFFQCSSKCKIQDKKHRNEKNASSPAVEDDLVLSPSIEKGDTCYGKWSCCGKNCYYFSKEVKTWHESKKSCEGRGSHLIKIDDEEEQSQKWKLCGNVERHMVIGSLSSDIVSEASHTSRASSPRAEEQGQQSQHILAVFLPKPVLQLVKPQGKHTAAGLGIMCEYQEHTFLIATMSQDEKRDTETTELLLKLWKLQSPVEMLVVTMVCTVILTLMMIL